MILFSPLVFPKDNISLPGSEHLKMSQVPLLQVPVFQSALGDVTMGNHTRLEAPVPGGCWQLAVMQQDIN